MSSESETMKKKSKRKLTPKLRFPEFLDESGWEEVPLEQLADRVTTKNLDGSIERVLTNSAEYGIVNQRDYFDKDIANAGNIDGYYIVDLGDYVYNPRISALAPVGPISRNNIGKGVMSPLYTVFRFAAENTDFYQHYFKTVSWHLYLRRVSSMGARHDRMSITTGDFMAMPVPTPPAREQEKIADCLGSLDGLIAAEGRKLEALKAHKKGLMQQLFPQPGQSQPRLRLPKFRDKVGWKEKALRGFFPRIRNGFVGTATPYYTDDGVPYLQGKNIKCGRIERFNTVTISKAFHERQKKSQLQINDILMVQSGHVGECAVVDEAHAGANCHALIILSSETNPCPYFFLQLFYSEYGKEKIAEITTGNTVKHILASGVKALKLSVPGLEERERISECLTTLDTQIAAQSAKIDALRAHKRGLMQQLFPAPEER